MLIFKSFETPIWNGKQNSLTGPVITGSFEKRAPGVKKGGFEISLAPDLKLSFSPLNRLPNKPALFSTS